MLHFGSSKHSSNFEELSFGLKNPSHPQPKSAIYIQVVVHLRSCAGVALAVLQPISHKVFHQCCCFQPLIFISLLLRFSFGWRGCEMPSGQRLTWMATTTTTNNKFRQWKGKNTKFYLCIYIYKFQINISILYYNILMLSVRLWWMLTCRTWTSADSPLVASRSHCRRLEFDIVKESCQIRALRGRLIADLRFESSFDEAKIYAIWSTLPPSAMRTISSNVVLSFLNFVMVMTVRPQSLPLATPFGRGILGSTDS